MPRHSPLLSGCEKPASPVLTPHCTKPFLTTASAVAAYTLALALIPMHRALKSRIERIIVTFAMFSGKNADALDFIEKRAPVAGDLFFQLPARTARFGELL